MPPRPTGLTLSCPGRTRPEEPEERRRPTRSDRLVPNSREAAMAEIGWVAREARALMSTAPDPQRLDRFRTRNQALIECLEHACGAPSSPRRDGHDRRAMSRTTEYRAACGTRTGLLLHRDNGEQPCGACLGGDRARTLMATEGRHTVPETTVPNPIARAHRPAPPTAEQVRALISPPGHRCQRIVALSPVTTPRRLRLALDGSVPA